jgi:hypothetical protein
LEPGIYSPGILLLHCAPDANRQTESDVQDTHYMSEEDYYGPAEDYQENRVLAENFDEDLGFGSEAFQEEHHHQQQQQQEDPEPEQSRKRGGGAGANKNKTHAYFVKGRAQALQHLLELPLKTRQLFCVSEFYRHMALASPDSPCKVPFFKNCFICNLFMTEVLVLLWCVSATELPPAGIQYALCL